MGTTESILICGKEVSLGDYVKVEYATGERMKDCHIEGKLTKLWSPENDNHHQAQINNGWCFHDYDLILEHQSTKRK